MAELASVKPYQLIIPDNGSYYQPRLNLHDYSVQEFTAPYAFGPHLTGHEWDNASAALDNGIARVGQRFSPEGQAARSQATLANDLSTGADTAYRNALLDGKTDSALNGGATVSAPAVSNLSDRPVLTTGPLTSVAPAGNTFTATATGYHPVSPSDPAYKMEGGNLDAQGNPIHTLDAFRRGDAPDVTVAVDKSSPLYGQTGFSQELNAPVKFTDTGSAFAGKGTARVDVARDTAAGANSNENNRPLTFTLNSTASGTMPLFPLQPNVAQPQPQSVTVTPNAATRAFNSAPVAIGEQPKPLILPSNQTLPVSTVAPTQTASPFLQALTAAYGTGHPTVNANGTVGYETVAPLSAAQQQLNAATLQFKQQEAARDAARAANETRLANQRPTTVLQTTDADGNQVQQIVHTDDGSIVATLGAKGGAQGHKTQVIQTTDEEGKPQQMLVDSQTGEVIKNYGAKPAPTGRAMLSPPTREMNVLQQRYQTNKPIQGYLSVANAVQSIKDNLAIPLDKRTAVDDDALEKAVAGVEQPGKQPTVSDKESLESTGGYGDRFQAAVSGILNNKRRLGDNQVQSLGQAALRKAEGMKKSYDAEMGQLMHQAKTAGIDPFDVFERDAIGYYHGVADNPLPSNKPDAAGQQSSVAVNSQAEYDALPSGALYTDSNGVLHRKK